MSKKQTKNQWSSRFGFIFAALGMAVGTGNIWRFPRIAGQNYGGTFIIAYIVCNFLWVFPLLLMEMGIGKSTRLGTVGAFGDFNKKNKSHWGTFIGWVCAAITFYYAVVFGQALRYFTFAINGNLKAGMDADALWNGFVSDPKQTITFMIIACLLMGYVMYKGVNDGLEKLGKFAVPILFVSLLVVGIWSVTQENSSVGLNYLFVPDFDHIFDAEVWLAALTQAAWSAGAGWGMMLTYANYFKKDEDIVVNSAMITFGDMTGAILGSFAVLPAVFALSTSESAAIAALESGNIGLTFKTLASLFPTMPGGQFIAILFFLSLCLASLTSIVPQAEVVVKNLEDFGISRKKAAVGFAAATIIFALPSAIWEDFLANQDWVYGIGLLVCGIFYVMSVFDFGLDKFRKEVINVDSDIRLGKIFNVLMYIFPVLMLTVIGYNFYDTYTADPANAFNILSSSSIGTVGVQLLLAFIIARIIGKNLYRRISSKQFMKNGKFIGED